MFKSAALLSDIFERHRLEVSLKVCSFAGKHLDYG